MSVEKKTTRPVPPTMRGKKRYVLFELKGGKGLAEQDVSKALWGGFLRLYGELGTAKMKLWLANWDPKEGKGIVRCALEHLDECRSGIVFVGRVSGREVVPQTLKTSGSIRKLKAAK